MRNKKPIWDDLYKALNEVSRPAIINAISSFNNVYNDTNDYDRWLEKKNYKYALLHEGKYYPPKYIMGLATKTDHRYFYGGWGKYGVNGYFEREHFDIVDKPNE